MYQEHNSKVQRLYLTALLLVFQAHSKIQFTLGKTASPVRPRIHSRGEINRSCYLTHNTSEGGGGLGKKTPPVFPVSLTLKHWLNEPFFPTTKARINKVLLF